MRQTRSYSRKWISQAVARLVLEQPANPEQRAWIGVEVEREIWTVRIDIGGRVISQTITDGSIQLATFTPDSWAETILATHARMFPSAWRKS